MPVSATPQAGSKPVKTVRHYGTYMLDIGLCPKNPQSTFFGLLKYKGPHALDLMSVRVAPWGPPAWKKYEYSGACTLCQQQLRDFALRIDDLARLGILDIAEKRGADFKSRCGLK